MADPVPHDIRAIADERARARRARDWATADRLKSELEAAGWRVVDAGTMYSLERRPPSVVEVDGEAHYGASDAVPSRLAEPPGERTTVVLVADDAPGLLPRSVAALAAHSPGTQVVVVANAPADAVAREIATLPAGIEVVRLAPRLGAAAARNAGIRRASGEVVVLLSPRLEVGEDLVGRLAACLEDPSVAIAGVEGLTTTDLVHFAPADPGTGDAVAVSLAAMAFRRGDYVERGPLDEHFAIEAYLDAWWGLVLRDVAEDAAEEAVPRRAAVVDARYDLMGDEHGAPDERLEKRQRYRFLKSFATRRDLLTVGADPQDGAGE